MQGRAGERGDGRRAREPRRERCLVVLGPLREGRPGEELSGAFRAAFLAAFPDGELADRYRHALEGVVVAVPRGRVRELATLPGVAAVHPLPGPPYRRPDPVERA